MLGLLLCRAGNRGELGSIYCVWVKRAGEDLVFYTKLKAVTIRTGNSLIATMCALQ